MLLVLGALLVPQVFLPRGKHFERLLQEALAQNQMTSALRTEINNGVVRMAHAVEITALIVIVVLMVFKPF